MSVDPFQLAKAAALGGLTEKQTKALARQINAQQARPPAPHSRSRSDSDVARELASEVFLQRLKDMSVRAAPPTVAGGESKATVAKKPQAVSPGGREQRLRRPAVTPGASKAGAGAVLPTGTPVHPIDRFVASNLDAFSHRPEMPDEQYRRTVATAAATQQNPTGLYIEGVLKQAAHPHAELAAAMKDLRQFNEGTHSGWGSTQKTASREAKADRIKKAHDALLKAENLTAPSWFSKTPAGTGKLVKRVKLQKQGERRAKYRRYVRFHPNDKWLLIGSSADLKKPAVRGRSNPTGQGSGNAAFYRGGRRTRRHRRKHKRKTRRRRHKKRTRRRRRKHKRKTRHRRRKHKRQTRRRRGGFNMPMSDALLNQLQNAQAAVTANPPTQTSTGCKAGTGCW